MQPVKKKIFFFYENSKEIAHIKQTKNKKCLKELIEII